MGAKPCGIAAWLIGPLEPVLVFYFLVGLVSPSPGYGQARETQPIRNISVRFDGNWIDASQGVDETEQRVRIAVWGSLREPSFFRKGFVQLDADPEKEYVVISRNPGTGPYYKLQIIDFHRDGILSWAYDSRGKPKLDGKRIFLGHQPDSPQGAHTMPQYLPYKYSAQGLTLSER